MPQAKQRSQRGTDQHRSEYSQAADPGVRLTEEGIKEFLDTCREKGLVKGTVERYRNGLKHLYQDPPEDKTIRRGTLESWRKELLEYAKRRGYLSGPIFLTRNGAPVNRAYVSASIRSICGDARVPSEKGNPRCLKRLYQATKSGSEDNISLLVEQAMGRLLEREQLAVGWEEG